MRTRFEYEDLQGGPHWQGVPPGLHGCKCRLIFAKRYTIKAVS